MWKRSRETKPSRRASLPDGIRVYAIGDIHGRADLLALQIAQIDADSALFPCARSILVFLGDYIDRGPDSAGCLALIAGPPPLPGVPTINRIANPPILVRPPLASVPMSEGAGESVT